MIDEINFSVIVCCYNPDIDKLKKTLISIDKQESVSFEIIITDDGSKIEYLNNIKEWCNIFIRSNVIFNFNIENKGTISNIISALRLAKGKYIKCISPGDYLYDEKSLRKYLNVFNKKNSTLVFGDAVYYNECLNIVKPLAPANRLSLSGFKVKRNVGLYCDYILGATIAFNKDKALNYLTTINEGVKFLEDVSLTFFAILYGDKISGIKHKTIWYEYGSGISTNSSRVSILNKDYEYLYNYFINLNCKYIKKGYKIRNIRETTNNRILKQIKIIMKSPCYLFYLLEKYLLSRRQKKSNIKDMLTFTSISS